MSPSNRKSFKYSRRYNWKTQCSFLWNRLYYNQNWHYWIYIALFSIPIQDLCDIRERSRDICVLWHFFFLFYYRVIVFTEWLRKKRELGPTKKWGSLLTRRKNSFWLWRGEMWPRLGGRTLFLLYYSEYTTMQPMMIIHTSVPKMNTLLIHGSTYMHYCGCIFTLFVEIKREIQSTQIWYVVDFWYANIQAMLYITICVYII